MEWIPRAQCYDIIEQIIMINFLGRALKKDLGLGNSRSEKTSQASPSASITDIFSKIMIAKIS